MKKYFILLIINVLFSCQSSKNPIDSQIKELKLGLAGQWKIMLMYDKKKIKLVEDFIKKVKKTSNFNQKYIDSVEIAKKNVLLTQLDQQKMYDSNKIDEYDQATTKMLVLLNKIDLSSQKEIQEIREKIKEIDNGDLLRRIHYDDLARTWNLICKTENKLKKVPLFSLTGE